MLLVIDVGNTNIVTGIYQKQRLEHVWRLTTNKERTSDEFGVFFITMFQNENIKISDISDVIISSVAPNIMYSLLHSIRKFFNLEPLLVEPGIKTGLNIKIDNPKELGADIIVNAVGAKEKYKTPLIIVDFGTATTLCAINSKNDVLGVTICPGVRVSADALTVKTAKLPNVQIAKPKNVLGKNTVDSMQAGLIYGFVGEIDYLVNKIKDEMVQLGEKREKISVIATGGLSRLIATESKEINEIDSMLTLDGLRMIHEKNKK
ncbi:MAG: type III pantothenate kinase [Clostridiales bacterium]|nr:type III pantothenate kinase [Clostridiales bacterium]